jgi:twitching motility protein PilT
MDQHLADLVRAGTVSYEAAIEKAHDIDGLDRLLQGFDSKSAGPSAPYGAIDFGDSFSKAVR